MENKELISLFVTLICVLVIAVLLIILYKIFVRKECAKVEKGCFDLDLAYDILESKEKRNNKTLKVIKQVVMAVIFVFLSIFLVKLGISRYKNEPFMIFNKSIIAVASGSMSFKNEVNDYLFEENLNDQFQAFDIILVDKVSDKSELKVYDVISFKHDGINVIHRIIRINEDGTYQTQGDANNAEDNYTVSFNDVVGKYNGSRVQKLGLVILFLQSYAGMATCLLLFGSLFIVDKFNNKVDDACQSRSKVLKPLILGDDLSPVSPKAKYVLYFNGYEYYFGNYDYLGKNFILDNKFKEKSNNKIIRKKIEKGD